MTQMEQGEERFSLPIPHDAYLANVTRGDADEMAADEMVDPAPAHPKAGDAPSKQAHSG